MLDENRAHIDDLIKKIEEQIPVEEIILFGSHAYGNPNEDSDIDLCVISKLNGQRKIDLVRKARRAITSVTSQPVDILIYDQKDFYRRANVTSTLEFKIKNKGVKVYGQ